MSADTRRTAPNLGETREAFTAVPGSIARRLRDLDDIDGDPQADADWARFIQILREVDAEFGQLDPNVLRERLRGQISPPQRVSRFYGMAKAEGYISRRPVQIATSDDRRSRNAGKPIRVYRFQEPPS